MRDLKHLRTVQSLQKKYLDNEIRAHRWIQMSLTEELEELESLGHVPLNCGYTYVDDNGTDMVEYHVNTSYHFEERLSNC